MEKKLEPLNLKKLRLLSEQELRVLRGGDDNRTYQSIRTIDPNDSTKEYMDTTYTDDSPQGPYYV